MINEEKVTLMTKAAIAEQHGVTDFRTGKYYKRDYVNYHVLLVGICVTIAMVLILGLVAVIFIENYPEKAQHFDWISAGFAALLGYLIVLVFYVIITMIVYTVRYNRASSKIKEYSQTLKRLDNLYNVLEEQKASATLKEAQEWADYDREKKQGRRKIARRRDKE
ncbi:MAG: hypothetical protein K6F92_00260 [Lachnospiraceae bacterium]|nr:hypothetical protein [Lachnospiraceae bacterium]